MAPPAAATAWQTENGLPALVCGTGGGAILGGADSGVGALAHTALGDGKPVGAAQADGPFASSVRYRTDGAFRNLQPVPVSRQATRAFHATGTVMNIRPLNARPQGER